jgi:hypothetical protein
MPVLTKKDVENRGGWYAISQEAMPSLASKAAIFANAPALTKFIMISVRAFPIVISFDGTDATTSVGIDLAVGTYTLDLDYAEAVKCEAIQNGGTATGYIIYFGVK